MSDKAKPDAKGEVVTLKLNQQQLELLDRTVARGVARDRADLVRLALREFTTTRTPTSTPRTGS